MFRLGIQLGQGGGHVSHRGRTGGDDDVACGHVGPIVLPGALDRFDVGKSLRDGVIQQCIEHAPAVVETVDALHAISQHQGDGAGAAAHVQQGSGAAQVHAVDEGAYVAPCAHMLAHLGGTGVPERRRFLAPAGGGHVFPVDLAEIDIENVHLRFSLTMTEPQGRTARPQA